MSESFAELFEQSQIENKMRPGSIISAKVLDIKSDTVIVNAGLKSEGIIPIDQFYDESGELEITIGDDIDVSLDSIEDGYGVTRLSREKAKRKIAWEELEKAHEENKTVTGIITDRVKGGFTVEVGKVRAFLPGSLVDVRPVRDTTFLEGKPIDFKVIKVDQRRNNIVVSRRAVVETETNIDIDEVIETLKEGALVKGIVKNLTDYGAFIDLGGIDGLLHITDMAWKRVKNPSEIVGIGDEIEVKVLKFDSEKKRVSLGLKQMGDDPWLNLTKRYPEGENLSGKVTSLADYGCFVELEEGVEGLVHVSEMDWTNKNVHPSKLVHIGQEVNVKILDIDQERRRISLGIKQCEENPWEKFASNHNKGDHVTGTIKSITDFGIFIGLDGGIDGLVHMSDVSWNDDMEASARNFSKGDEIKTVVLGVDSDRERISLGIKQLEDDPFSSFVTANQKGSLVNGIVKKVDQELVVISLTDEVEGTLKASEISIENEVSDARTVLKDGDEIAVKIIHIDRRKRLINLSIKEKESDEEQSTVDEYAPKTKESSKLGDILKEQLEK
ncbi:MAG: 30S ribosomal protein S1 [Legionellales bacterium]|nr:30S ribosomal protein S1 [Legionellales bacterium]|tara:strand:+ start:1797 stop:3464 length:1668 start_codon:yes stop_codon:yes gene_type:complete